MFRQIVNRTPFCGDPFVDKYFEEKKIIQGVNYNGDVTFLSTLRAICSRHIPEGDSLNLWLTNASEPTWEGRTLYNYSNSSNGIAVVNTDTVDNENLIKNMPDGFKYFEKPHIFFAQSKINVLCFQNFEKKMCILIICGLTMQRWHALQAGITTYLPWYFVKDRKRHLEDDEMAVLNGFIDQPNPDNYISALQVILDKLHIREEYIKSSLKDMELNGDRELLQDLMDDKKQKERDVESYLTYIAQNSDDIENLNTRINGLSLKLSNIENQDSPLATFVFNLVEKGVLVVKSVRNSEIRFIVQTTMDYIDEELIKAALRNSRSHIYAYETDDFSSDDMHYLIEQVYINHRAKIRCCAAYRLDTRHGVAGLSGYNFPSNVSKDRVPNTHIQMHGCLGGYGSLFGQLLKARDFIGIINQCIVSCQSMNVGDISFGEWIEYLYSMSEKSYVEIEGECYKPLDAIAKLREEDGGVE